MEAEAQKLDQPSFIIPKRAVNKTLSEILAFTLRWRILIWLEILEDIIIKF